MKDKEICELANEAFAGSPRPEHFTNYTHCAECEEHDNLLRSRNLDTLQISDVDNPGWDPVCFLNPSGWLYYFPALVRLSFSDPDDSYINQFLFHLSWRHREEDVAPLNKEQIKVIISILQHVRNQHIELIRADFDENLLKKTIEIWTAKI